MKGVFHDRALKILEFRLVPVSHLARLYFVFQDFCQSNVSSAGACVCVWGPVDLLTRPSKEAMCQLQSPTQDRCPTVSVSPARYNNHAAFHWHHWHQTWSGGDQEVQWSCSNRHIVGVIWFGKKTCVIPVGGSICCYLLDFLFSFSVPGAELVMETAADWRHKSNTEVHIHVYELTLSHTTDCGWVRQGWGRQLLIPDWPDIIGKCIDVMNSFSLCVCVCLHDV